jgi:adenosylmethionine-8-amino-7-oxononanoate aminotransferase
MSFHSWLNQGRPNKTRFVTLENSYHGETLGALAVGNVELYRQTYHPLLMETFTVPSPDCYNREPGESWHDYSVRQFEKLEQLLAAHADEICAVIIEPLIQCAGNMRMYDPVYLKLLRAACDRYDVHLIADEIATGFGRTGTLFACEQADISPDFMCLSKGLTGGYLPLSVVLTGDSIYDSFYHDYRHLKAFLHSHSYTGNPLGCRAALATLDIFREDNVIENNKSLAAAMRAATAHLVEHPHVSDVRQTGMVVAVEMCKDKHSRTPYPWQERRGLCVYQHGLEKGVLLRPLGNVVYMMPPYVISTEEINLAASVASDGITLATAG